MGEEEKTVVLFARDFVEENPMGDDEKTIACLSVACFLSQFKQRHPRVVWTLKYQPKRLLHWLHIHWHTHRPPDFPVSP